MKNDSNNRNVLISGSLLAKNTFWNLLGQGLPLLVGLVTIPILIDELGTNRFGVLTIAWMVIGYFSIFDFGLGRALTKLTAEKLGSGEVEKIPSLVWTALLLMGLLGILGGAFVASITYWLVYSVLNIPQQLQRETVQAFYLLAFSIPFVIETIGLRGVLEAYQRFKLVSALRIPLGIWTFVGPLVALQYSNSLDIVVGMLVLGRLAALLAHFVACNYVVPELKDNLTFKGSLLPSLLSFGGWMSLSNIVGPVMVYMDRFLIGAIITMSAVAYYATPYEVVTKLWLIPMAIVGVLFPAFSTSYLNDKTTTAELFDRGTKYIFIVMFPLTLTIFIFSYEGLEVWLGKEFAENGHSVLRWMALGVFINSLARVPLALIHGAGRPKITALVHLIELPLYLCLLWWLLNEYGVVGAAAAWTIRIIIDYTILQVVASRLLKEAKRFIKLDFVIIFIALAFFLASVLVTDIFNKSIYLFILIIIHAFLTWNYIFSIKEQRFINKLLSFEYCKK